MSDKNDFTSVIKSLLEGTDGMLCAKTVVGNAIRVGETILIPLSDVTIGCAAGSDTGDKKNKGAGGFSAKMTPSAVLIIKDGNTKVVNIKDQNSLSRLIDLVPEVVDKFVAAKQGRDMMSEESDDSKRWLLLIIFFRKKIIDDKEASYACSTLPARRHFVQTFIFLTPPETLTDTL